MRPNILSFLSEHGITLYVPDYKAIYLTMVVIALVLSVVLAMRRGLPAIRFYLATIAICLSAFLGSRVFVVMLDMKHSLTLPISEVLLGSDTASSGAYAGGIIGALLILRWMQIKVLEALDIYAPVLALSLSIGRLGCFISGCCYGRPSQLPWSIAFPVGSPAYAAQLAAGAITPDASYSLSVHPTQLYESLFGMVSFLLLLWLGKKNRHAGLLCFIYLASYATFRFFVEFLRGDDRGMLGTFSMPQVFSVAFLIFSVVGLIYTLSSSEGQTEEIMGE